LEGNGIIKVVLKGGMMMKKILRKLWDNYWLYILVGGSLSGAIFLVHLLLLGGMR